MGEMNKLDLDRQVGFGDICLKLKDLYIEKNRRYNDSFHKQFEEFGLVSAVMRLNDKMLRLKQLVKNPDDCGDEPIVDTLKDMANYAIMTLMELEPVEAEEPKCEGDMCASDIGATEQSSPVKTKFLCPKCYNEVINEGKVPYPYYCSNCCEPFAEKDLIKVVDEDRKKLGRSSLDITYYCPTCEVKVTKNCDGTYCCPECGESFSEDELEWEV